MTATDQPVGRGRRLAAGAVVAVAVVVAPTAHGLQLLIGTFDISSLATTGLLFAMVGALVMVRQPRNLIGGVLATIGVASVLGALSEAVTTVTYGTEMMVIPGALWAGWFGEWYWLPTIWLQFVFVPLLFPDGRPHGPGWRRYAVAATVIACACTLLAVGGQELFLDGIQLGLPADSDVSVVLDSPVGVLPLGNFERDLEPLVLLLPLFAIGAAVSLVRRFRAATGDVRDQLKVAAIGISMAAAGFPLLAAIPDTWSETIGVVELPLILLIPVSLGVAILRYRLYAIDRVISRALAYAIVSLVLAGTYLGLVVVLGSVARTVTGEAGDLVVALSTLVVAAAFQPVRRQVQQVVDRRFNRARYDAAVTIDAYGRTLRDEVSRDAVVRGLRGTVVRTFQPASVGVVLMAAEAES